VRRLPVLVVGLALGACARPAPVAPGPAVEPLRRYVGARPVTYAHLAGAVRTGDTVRAGAQIGTIDTMPTVQSERHQAELLGAREMYEQARFVEAARSLEPALRDEPDNRFLLNERGRALFRVDDQRPESRRTYERLVRLIDAEPELPAGGLVVDLWFLDAYWKLGMLYLDVEDYRGALEQFAKVALATTPDDAIQEQLYSYLAETFYYLHDRDAADYYARRALARNPRNTYVVPYRKRR
jgi:tetratricopeptide (TPR) repeat protein